MFSCTDDCDLRQMVPNCLKTDSLAYQTFNVSNGYDFGSLRYTEILERHYNDVPVRSDCRTASFFEKKSKMLIRVHANKQLGEVAYKTINGFLRHYSAPAYIEEDS